MSDAPGSRPQPSSLDQEHKAIEILRDILDRGLLGPHAQTENRVQRLMAGVDHYRKHNPLGGPAVVFRAMASRIEAGEEFYSVLKDYGFSSVSESKAPTAHPETDRCGFDRDASLSEDCYVCTCGYVDRETPNPAPRSASRLPSAIYVWLVPSEQVLEQPGSWRIRKWDTEPFPEANFTLATGSSTEPLKEEKDEAYRQRNVLVAALARLYPSGVRRTNIEGWSSDWHGCVYIDLPAGQISYHYHDSQSYLFLGLPAYTKPWDGHDKETVEKRLASVSATEERTPEERARLYLLGLQMNRWQRRARELLDNWNAPAARTLIEEFAANTSATADRTTENKPRCLNCGSTESQHQCPARGAP